MLARCDPSVNIDCRRTTTSRGNRQGDVPPGGAGCDGRARCVSIRGMDARTLIDRRYSCRTYLEQPISTQDNEALTTFMAQKTSGPLGSPVRFGLIAASSDDESALKRLGTYGFIKGATGFHRRRGAAAGRGDLEDYGYLLEEVILYATATGPRHLLARRHVHAQHLHVRRFGGLERDETMPAVVSIGYIGRRRHGAHPRARRGRRGGCPADELFFARRRSASRCGDERAAATPAALEAVRMAPSATNKQPWRIVRRGGDWHFYLQRTKGYGKGSPLVHGCCASPTCSAWTWASPCATSTLVAREVGPRRPLGQRGSRASTLPGPGVEYTATWRS